jgi:hypothetical protein
VDHAMHRVAHRIQQQRRGRDDQRDAEHGDQRRRPALCARPSWRPAPGATDTA